MSACPRCKSTDNAVIDSRHASFRGQSTIRRRRECDVCGTRWTTHEVPIERDLQMKLISLKYELKEIVRRCDNAISAITGLIHDREAVPQADHIGDDSHQGSA